MDISLHFKALLLQKEKNGNWKEYPHVSLVNPSNVSSIYLQSQSVFMGLHNCKIILQSGKVILQKILPFHKQFSKVPIFKRF